MSIKDLIFIKIWDRGVKAGTRQGRRKSIADLDYYAKQLAALNEYERQTQPENKKHAEFEDGMVAGIRMAMIMLQDEIKLEAASNG